VGHLLQIPSSYFSISFDVRLIIHKLRLHSFIIIEFYPAIIVLKIITKQAPNARICMLTEVGSGRKLEPTEDAGEAVPEL
jgi:hypothetical protein